MSSETTLMAGRTAERRAGTTIRPYICLFFCLMVSLGPGANAQEESPPPAGDPIRTYLQAIEEIQTRDGPYAIDLIDLYFGYGQSLLEDGDFKGARDAFYRTALVSRVNNGPNSLQQADYLYSIAQIESILGNLEESISVLENVYLLHARHHGENDPAMLPVVQQIQDWYETKKPLKAPYTRASDLQNLSYLAGRRADLTEISLGLGNVETALRFRSEGQVNFRAILFMIRSGEPPLPELVMNQSGSGSQWYFDRTLSNHFTEGSDAYERAVAAWQHNPDATALDVAEATAQLGDWYLALKHFKSAEKSYERAYQILVESEEFRDIADQYLGQPSPLRFLNTEGAFARNLDAPLAEGGLEIAMTVNRNGRLYNVEILSAPPGQPEDDLNRLTESLENTRFRPAVVSGEVARVERYIWRPSPIVPKVAARDG